MKQIILLLLIMVLVVSSSLGMAIGKNPEMKTMILEKEIPVPESLLEKAKQSPDEIQRVIIIFHKKPEGYKNFIEDPEGKIRGRIIHDYDIIEGVAIILPARLIERLTELENLVSIQEDRIVHAFLSESIPLIKADDVWALGYNGSGKTVCVVDTGIDSNHPDLQGKVIAEKCYCCSRYAGANCKDGCCPGGGWEEDDAMDDDGHGTHCAGIIASQNETYKGVAPGVDLMGVKVLDEDGSGYMSDVIAGIDWCSDRNADVISLSLGGATKYSNYCDGLADAEAVNNAVDAGSVVAVASGNDGWTDGISSPACASKAISVGSVKKNDVIASYTNRNSILDLLAPGGVWDESPSYSEIVSLFSPNVAADPDLCFLEWGTPLTCYDNDYKVNSDFIRCSGTSQAAPHVSGAAALLLEANPSSTPAEIESLLKNTGINVYDGASGLTFPRIDVLAALTLPPLGHLEPYLIDPISDKNVTQNEFFTFSSGVECVGGECGNVSATLDPETEIYYDDGTPTTYYSDSNFIWAVRFTSPSYPLTITQAKVRFYDLNGIGSYTATVHVYDDNNGVPGNELITPFDTTIDEFNPSWEIIPMDVLIVSGDFWIGISAPGDPDGPYALADADTTTSRSVGGDGSTWYSLDKDLMLRAFVKEGKGAVPMNSGTPFYTTSNNPQTCHDMQNGSTCNQTWEVNATGNIGNSYEFFTLYEPITHASYIDSNRTEKINITIVGAPTEIISITLSGYPIEFGPLDPGTDDNQATGNSLNRYNITINPETTVNVDLYQKGNDFINDGSIFGVGNMTWSTTNDVGTSQATTNVYSTPIATNVPSGTNITMYYWLDVPAGKAAGTYSASVYIKAVETEASSSESELKITEIYYDTLVAYEPDEYVRICNLAASSITLDGLYITDFEANSTFPTGYSIAGNECVIIAREGNAFAQQAGELPNFEMIDTNASIPDMLVTGNIDTGHFANSGDEILLINPNGNVIDAFIYGDSAYTGEGWVGSPVSLVDEQQFQKYYTNNELLVRNRKRNELVEGQYLDTNSSSDWDNNRMEDYVRYIGQSRFDYPEYFTHTGNITLFTSPDTAYEEITNFIDSASSSLYISLYDWNNFYIMDYLANASNRGVEVKVLLDGDSNDFAGVTDDNKYIAQQIEAAGGDVAYMVDTALDSDVRNRYASMHPKYAVADGQDILIGSGNWKNSSVPVDPSIGNREWYIIIWDNSALASFFTDVFNDDYDIAHKDIAEYCVLAEWCNPPGGFEPNRTVQTGNYTHSFASSNLAVSNMPLQVILSPDTSMFLNKSIIGMLKSAGSGSKVYWDEFYAWKCWGIPKADCTPETHPNVYLEETINAARRGAIVRILLDSTDYNIDGTNENQDTVAYVNDIATTESLDLEARLANYSITNYTKIHNKGMIVDDKVLISSINVNFHSTHLNREAGVIITNQEIADYFEDVFWYDWNGTMPGP